jgi:hypothetical protein
MDEGYASYFCSQECYEANLVRHWILPPMIMEVMLTQLM